jgi:hypothetical protein
MGGFNELSFETGKIRLLSPADLNLALQENQPVSTAPHTESIYRIRNFTFAAPLERAYT